MRIHLNRLIIFVFLRQFLRFDILYSHNTIQQCHGGRGEGDDKDVEVPQILSDQVASVVWSDHSKHHRGLCQGVSSDSGLRFKVWQISNVTVYCHVEVVVGSSYTKYEGRYVVQRYTELQDVMGVKIIQQSIQSICQALDDYLYDYLLIASYSLIDPWRWKKVKHDLGYHISPRIPVSQQLKLFHLFVMVSITIIIRIFLWETPSIEFQLSFHIYPWGGRWST